MPVFSIRLRELRLERGEKQADVAAILNVSIQSYSAYESGREPKYEMLNAIATHYDVTANYLTGYSDQRTTANENIGRITGLTNLSIERVKKMNTIGAMDIFNDLLTHENFMGALFSLAEIREKGFSPDTYFGITTTKDKEAVESGGKGKAWIVPGSMLNGVLIMKAKEKMSNAIDEVAEDIQHSITQQRI